MKHLFFILLLAGMVIVPCLWADDYVDDVYYSAEKSIRHSNPNQPIYDKKVKEFIFLDDTTRQHPDTVRALIRYK